MDRFGVFRSAQFAGCVVEAVVGSGILYSVYVALTLKGSIDGSSPVEIDREPLTLTFRGVLITGSAMPCLFLVHAAE